MPITAPSLSITDTADGTGGTATLAGGDVGATNTLYSQRVDGELGGNVWVSRGSRTGNGTIAITIGATLPVGYYWWRVESVLASEAVQSNLVYQNISDGATAVHYRCLVAAQARIQGLSLAGIAADRGVILRKIPIDRHMSEVAGTLPGVIIAPSLTEAMNPTAGTNVRDDVGYPVAALIVAADNQDLTTNIDVYLKWREQLARAFRNQKLPGVSEVWNCVVEPVVIVEPNAWLANMLVSALVLRFFSREVRGLS